MCMFEVIVHGKSLNDAICVGFRRGRPGPVPRSTLAVRVRNFLMAKGYTILTKEIRSRVALDQLRPFAEVTNCGRRRYFSDCQELALALLLQGLALNGKAMSFDMVLPLMEQCARFWGLQLRKESLLRGICEEVGVVYLRESVGTRQRATLPRADLARVLKSMIKDHLAALETAISVAQNRISNQSP